MSFEKREPCRRCPRFKHFCESGFRHPNERTIGRSEKTKIPSRVSLVQDIEKRLDHSCCSLPRSSTSKEIDVRRLTPDKSELRQVRSPDSEILDPVCRIFRSQVNSGRSLSSSPSAPSPVSWTEIFSGIKEAEPSRIIRRRLSWSMYLFIADVYR